MTPMPLVRCLFVLAAVLAAALSASAEVVRVAVTSRTDVDHGYEKIVGRIFFAVDPTAPHNALIADLDKAPRNAAGLVEFASDLYILRPKSGGNGVVLLDVVNRGRLTVLNSFNRSNLTNRELGDGFLLARGFTVMAVGWEFDVPPRDGAIRIEVPAAVEGGRAVSPPVTGQFTLDQAARSFTVTDLAGYTPAADGARPMLTVRDSAQDPPTAIPGGTWTLTGNTVTSTGAPFEAGRIYELTYHASKAPVAGLGFAAVRDVVSWARHDPQAIARAQQVMAFGSSQSGRFLRTFLYQGFNADGRRRQVFDGVIAHIAGAARLDINRRGATPTTLGGFSATEYPFSAQAQRDPVSGASEGLLDNDRARAHQPKIFFTNTGVEYWGGGRSAALIHTTPDGTRDVALGDNVRAYFLAGTQHGPGAFPPARGIAQQPANPTDYWWSMRALLVAMDRWVREGVAPPASRVPRLADGTLVAVKNLAFPALPGVQSPKTLAPVPRIANRLIASGGGAGALLPYLVPQVDADGNERAGIRLPDVAVPLATFTGWNVRSAAVGAPHRLVPLVGSYVPFTRAAIAARYASRDAYMAQIGRAAAALVKDGYLLEEDVAPIARRAAQHWELRMGS